MTRYVMRRILMMIPVLLGVSLVVFTMMYMTPGDPARIILGETATDEAVATLRQEMGLEEPFLVQFGTFLKNVFLRGNLGRSYLSGRDVSKEILERYPTTITLAVASVIVSAIIGIPLGILSAIRQYSIFDNIAMAFALVGVSMPNFWQGLVLILVFSVQLKWLPPSGFSSPAHWILPALTIGTSSAATVTRMTRSSMLEVIRQDYITTARAKGQVERVVVLKHALRNALIPILTTIGLSFGSNLGGAILTESVFSIPGLGKLMVEAIKARNYPVVQGGVLFIAMVFSFINLAIDVLYAFIDPRIKSQYGGSKKDKGAKKGQQLVSGGVS